jgi:hypothetical protein
LTYVRRRRALGEIMPEAAPVAPPPDLDRTSFLKLDKEELFRLLNLAVKGQRETAGNMLKMTELMRKADETMKALRDRIELLETENAELKKVRVG